MSLSIKIDSIHIHTELNATRAPAARGVMIHCPRGIIKLEDRIVGMDVSRQLCSRVCFGVMEGRYPCLD